jgi:hypothetical protein
MSHSLSVSSCSRVAQWRGGSLCFRAFRKLRLAEAECGHEGVGKVESRLGKVLSPRHVVAYVDSTEIGNVGSLGFRIYQGLPKGTTYFQFRPEFPGRS